MFKKKTLTVLASLMLFSSISIPTSYAATSSTSTENPTKIQSFTETEPEINFTDVSKALSAIENVPDSVLDQGIEATAQWLESETGFNVSIENDVLKFNEFTPGGLQSINVPACIGAIGIALISNGIPFAKITKVKSALNALGGTANAVKKIKKYYDKYRYNGFSRNDSLKKALNSASSGLSSNLKSSLLDFFNLTNVVANCS